MNLPEIEVVGLQSPQRLLQHFGGEPRFATMRTHLCHQKDFVAPALEALPHPIFRFPTMVFPAVVEERDPAIHGFLDNSNCGRKIGRIAEMMATEP
jgi:hypothetical protein